MICHYQLVWFPSVFNEYSTYWEFTVSLYVYFYIFNQLDLAEELHNVYCIICIKL